MDDHRLKLAFAGDRDVAVSVLAHLLEAGDAPLALLLSDEGRASHDGELQALCALAGLSPQVLRGRHLTDGTALQILLALDLDYFIFVHFPYVVRRPILDASKSGALNLHPGLLPYNRGWHTPTWSILDGTPAGATLHYLSERLDCGDVVYQEEVATDPGDTAHSLYHKVKDLEVRVFREGWRRICEGRAERIPQVEDGGTFHRRADLFTPAVQRIDLNEVVRSADLLRRLRALTTSQIGEAAYFESDDRRYRVQVTITPEGTP